LLIVYFPNVQYQKPEINNQQYGNRFYSPRNLESDRQSANSQYRPGTNQRLSNSNRNMERESERERENENGQTSFSMQISTKYGSGKVISLPVVLVVVAMVLTSCRILLMLPINTRLFLSSTISVL
jgi:hypothetical protein